MTMMKMKRRDFSASLVGMGLACNALIAHAQGKPVTDADFATVKPPVPTEKGKIQVIEFFWYGCPHCFSFEPLVLAWMQKLPADVQFQRVPVAFNASYVIHQRIFYALEVLGQVSQMHGKVFNALQVERQRLEKDDEVVAFMAKNGIDPKKFAEVFNSFSVNTEAKQASRLAESYKIEGVPTLGIQGRFITSGTHAGSPERSLVVANALIERVRKGG